MLDVGRVPTNHFQDGSNTTLSISHGRLSATAIIAPKLRTLTNRKVPEGHPDNSEPMKIAETITRISIPANGTNAIMKPIRIPKPEASRSQLDGRTFLPLGPPTGPNGESLPA